MFWQNNAILRDQLDYFLSYVNVHIVGGKAYVSACYVANCREQLAA
jgi:hypothetical protein